MSSNGTGFTATSSLSLTSNRVTTNLFYRQKTQLIDKSSANGLVGTGFAYQYQLNGYMYGHYTLFFLTNV